MNGRSAEALHTELGDATNTLFLSPPLDPHTDETCMELLQVTDLQAETVLSVVFTQSLTDRSNSWKRYVGTPAAEAAFIDVGQTTRSAPAQRLSTLFGPVTIDTVRSPTDLTGLGIAISDQLEAWRRDGNQIVVCFHSLTVLLQYVDVERAFRFLRELTEWMNTVDAVAHYHLDPDAHDEQTLDALVPLFDAVIRVAEDGECTVR